MIGAAKTLAKRYWPALRLRTILLAVLLFVAALPGVSAIFGCTRTRWSARPRRS